MIRGAVDSPSQANGEHISTSANRTRLPLAITMECLLLTATGFVVCAAYSFVDRRYGMPADLMVGLRFFVPLLPALTLGYVALLHQCWGQRIRSAGVPAAAAVQRPGR